MTPLDLQFEILKGYEPGSLLHKFPDGSHLLVVPDVVLPAGWTKLATEVRFIAPVGYPLSRPDCFWADSDLRLSNGNLPQNTAVNQIPNIASNHLWFSWHVASWDPNHDNLLTYLYVIRRRLHDPR